MTRVCYLIGTLDPGGAERQLINVVNALPEWVEPTIFVLRSRLALRTQIKNPRARVHVIGLRSRVDLLRWMSLYNRLRRSKPDVLHSHMLLSNLASRLLRPATGTRTLINQEHGLSLWKRGFLNTVDFLSHRVADQIIVVSKASRDSRLLRAHLDPSLITILPNAIDWPVLSAIPREPSHSDTPVWGVAARLVPIKRIHLAIQLLARVRRKGVDARLLIAGDGPERAVLVNHARELQVQPAVSFLGHLDDMAQFYSKVDIVLLTSELEDCPMSVLEGLACGRFIAATQVGGVPELLTTETDSATFDPESSWEPIVNTLSRIPAGYDSPKNRNYARQFDIDTHVERLLLIYDRLLRR